MITQQPNPTKTTRWEFKQSPPAAQIDQLSQAIHVNPYLARLLVQRKVDDFDKAKRFFRPKLGEHLHDPFLMRDMERAVDRIKQALDSDEKILIYGDYDVDGTTAVALVYRYFRPIHPRCAFYIPDRLKEGYGISEIGIRWAIEQGFSLVIALDLGITSIDAVALGRQRGLDFIICDHHLPGNRLPEAWAILNPKVAGCPYPFKELSGCGVGFKLVQAFARKYGPHQLPPGELALVAVSIASDIVPIDGENRVLAFHGLKQLNAHPIPGLKALKEKAALTGETKVSDIVFKLAPRINAAGRIGHARTAVDLLVAEQPAIAQTHAQQLEEYNTQRKAQDEQTTREALDRLNDPACTHAKSTVLYDEHWNRGIVGIVAARCVEHYYRPTIILAKGQDGLVGSGRSIDGFNLHRAISECASLLENFGGHKYAVGLALQTSNLPAFRHRFEQVVSAMLDDEVMLMPTFKLDMELPIDAITSKFVKILNQMAPFGPGNPTPLFMAKDAFVAGPIACFKDKHIRFSVGQRNNETRLTAWGFNMAEYRQLQPNTYFDMAFTIHENEFRGHLTVELRIKDIKFAPHHATS